VYRGNLLPLPATRHGELGVHEIVGRDRGLGLLGRGLSPDRGRLGESQESKYRLRVGETPRLRSRYGASGL
jgi:hypothetical protein